MRSKSSRQVLPQPHALVVELHAFGRQIVGADDGSVAAGIAAAEVALVEHGDVADAVVAGQIIGGRQTVTAGADDDHIVAGLEPLVPREHARLRMLPGERKFEQSGWHDQRVGESAGNEMRVSIVGHGRSRTPPREPPFVATIRFTVTQVHCMVGTLEAPLEDRALG